MLKSCSFQTFILLVCPTCKTNSCYSQTMLKTLHCGNVAKCRGHYLQPNPFGNPGGLPKQNPNLLYGKHGSLGMSYMRLSDIYGPCTSGICRIMANHTQIHPGTKTHRPPPTEQRQDLLVPNSQPRQLAAWRRTVLNVRFTETLQAGPTTSRSAVTEDMLMKLLVQKKVGSCWISSLSPHKLFQRSQKTAKALVSPTAQSMCRRCISGHPKKS